MEWSKWRIMWVAVLFDLPTDTSEKRREYADFRKALLEDGFVMMQYSVYIRHCPSEENAEVHDQRVRNALPPEGEVRIIHFTDSQYGRMKVFHGKLRKDAEKAKSQLELF